MIWASRTPASLPAAMPPVRLEFVYDYMSRRCVKRLFDKSGEGAAAVGGSAIVEGSAAAVVQTDEEPVAPESGGVVVIPVGWTLTSTFKFVWDGWNLLAELDGEDGVLRACAWGLDLSGSEQGAGGVGGLVFEYLAKTDLTHHLYYDGNGNVTSLRDDGGALSCEYAYGPFGETLTARGDEGALAYNAFKFSTKYTDAESGLLYYGYRYYNPGTGRWLNRDPVAEPGGVNLFGFVNNSTPEAIDTLGLWTRDDWTGPTRAYTGTATAECNDTLADLARLITGQRGDARHLDLTTYGVKGINDAVTTGTVVDITPLLTILEDRLRIKVMNATSALRVNFGTGSGAAAGGGGFIDPGMDRRQFMRYFFQASTTNWADCNMGARAVLVKGLIDTAGGRDFDGAFRTWGNAFTYVEDSKVAIADAKSGDWLYVRNNEVYGDWYSRANPGVGPGPWAGEYVIKMRGNQLWGHGVGRTTYQGLETDLLREVNALAPPGASPVTTIVGYSSDHGVKFFNVARVGMKLFDYRKANP